MAVLEKKHALEATEEELTRQKEQLEMETQLAAAKAKIAILESHLMKLTLITIKQ